jgi:hypothetical protein
MVRESTGGDYKWHDGLRYMREICVIEGMMKIWNTRKGCAGG